MKHCVQYPDDKFLAVRPCLVAICFGNRPAAKLLGTLLYRYNLRVENKDDAENINAVKAAKGEKPDQDTTYRIFRKQSQLVDDMCGEMTEKTMHDTAIPMLRLLGFIDLEEHMLSNCYIVNIEQVQEALNLYIPTAKEQTQLEIFLINHIQLEKFLISTDQIETFNSDKKYFYSNKKYFLSRLEIFLIRIRNISNLKRGPKVKPEAASKGNSQSPQNLKESSKKNKKKDSFVASATHSPEEEKEQASTERRQLEEVSPPLPIATASPETALLQTEHEIVTQAIVTPELSPATVEKQAGDGDKSARGSRKPPKPKEEKNVPSPERIEAVFTCLDSLGKQYSEDGDYCYTRSKVSTQIIKEFLTNRALTQATLEAVYKEMWNTPPDEKTGFVWKNNMSVKAIFNNFDRFWLAAKSKQSKRTNGSSAPSNAASPRLGILRPMPTDEELRKEAY